MYALATDSSRRSLMPVMFPTRNAREIAARSAVSVNNSRHAGGHGHGRGASAPGLYAETSIGNDLVLPLFVP